MTKDALRHKLRASQQLFEAMDDQGADMDAIHAVEHHFISSDAAPLEEIQKDAVYLGFGFTQIAKTEIDGKVIFGADVLSRISVLSEDYDIYIPAARESVIMMAIAEAHGAEYDGWGTKIIKNEA